MRKPQPKGKSLIEFVLEKKRATCPICRLSSDVLEQIKIARAKKIQRPVVLEWLEKEHGVKITSAEFDTHNSARHVNGS